MANSKYAYVKTFEMPDGLLPGTFIVLRIDGKGFHRFSEEHHFAKPNDLRALQLMDHAAGHVMKEFRDIVFGYGQSDEFSFLLRKGTTLYNRRSSKILSTIVSAFTAAYVFHWSKFLPDTPLLRPPAFDGRIVLYPDVQHVRDYFSWRQADAHVNNLYNTAFWALVQQAGKTTTEAHERLRGTLAAQKHEILHKEVGINYNQINERYRKGSTLLWESLSNVAVKIESDDTNKMDATVTPINAPQPRAKVELAVMHCDIIQDTFWMQRSHILL